MVASTFLVMPLKVPPRFDLVQPLATWLDGDVQVDFQKIANPLQWVVPKPDMTSFDCRSELLRLAGLRNCLSESLQDSHKAALQENALEDCYEYHAALLEFQKQGFPTLDDEQNGLNLCWKGAFALVQKETHHTLIWDRACTLWNAAALLSSKISTTDLSTKDGCKTAIACSQTASSILSTLQELVQSEDYSTADLSQPMLKFWQNVILAQGQECVYKMANLGDTVRQHSTLAYLAEGACHLYNQALGYAQDPRLQSEVPRQSQDWGAHCKSTSMMLSAKAEFHLALEARQHSQWGLELKRLERCIQKLVDCLEFGKTAGLQLQHVEQLWKLAKDRFTKASQDNHQIYQDRIPQDVPEAIRAQQLVKSDLPLPNELLVPKVPLFTNNIKR